MGEAGFTPGPWSVRAPDSPLHILISANGDDVDGERNGGVYVARVTGPDALDNAPLIAAAPDTYFCTELLESLCAWLLHRFGPDSPEGKEASLRLTKARAALALARNTPVSDQGGGK